MEDEEAKELEGQMRALADQWRERLERPEVKAGLANGSLALSPLVRELLEAFPPRPTK